MMFKIFTFNKMTGKYEYMGEFETIQANKIVGDLKKANIDYDIEEC